MDNNVTTKSTKPNNNITPQQKKKSSKTNKKTRYNYYKISRFIFFMLLFPISFYFGFKAANYKPKTLYSNISVMAVLNSMDYDFAPNSKLKNEVYYTSEDGYTIKILGRNKVTGADITFKEGQNDKALELLKSLYPSVEAEEINELYTDLIESAKKYNYEKYNVNFKGDKLYSQMIVNENDGTDSYHINISIP